VSQAVTKEMAVPANLKHIDLSLPLSLNRAGKFTVELKVTDNITKKSSTMKFPLTVTAQDKGR